MLLIVLVSSVPGVVLTYRQLERQVWLRVEAAQASTLALYADERSRISDMALLVARRPTLCALVNERDSAALAAYLEEMRQGVRVDSLVVLTAGGVPMASASTAQWDFAALAPEGEPSADFRVSGSPPQLLIVAARPLESLPGCDPGTTSLVVVRVLDHVSMQLFSERTGVAQSLILGDVRASTSLAAAPDWSLNPSAAQQVVRSGSACCTRGEAEGEVYYVGLAPLTNAGGQVVALSEVALPGRALQAGMVRTIAFLLSVTVVTALVGFYLTVRLADHITQPLAQLAAAAVRMGGDLETPIRGSGRVAEIDTLARQLSQTRRRLSRSLQDSRQQRQRLEALLEATHDGVITLDIAGRVTSINAAAEHALGVGAYDLLEKRCLEVFRPAPGEAATIAHVLQPPLGAPPIRRVTVLNAQDAPITLEVSASWLDPDLAQPGVRERVIVFRDVSEEAALETLRSNFLANVSHEFRTPLASVIASAEVLVDEYFALSDDELNRLLDSIQTGTRHLRTLVDNLLETASVEAGSFRISYRPTQIADILEELKRTMEPLLRRRGQTLAIDLPDDLPALYADPDRLSQVFINLMANASKFGPTEKPITISVAQDADTITVAVLDSGPGLPGSDFGDLFQRFMTGPRMQGAQFGTGLGLRVVKAIVAAHGGTVGAENLPEGGAKVWFTLPVKITVPVDGPETLDSVEGDHPVVHHSGC